VSRWWPDRVLMTLAPDAATLTRTPRWPRRGAAKRHVVDRAGFTTAGDGGGAQPHWRDTLAAAAECLGAPGWRGLPVEVELSNHLVRYTVLPWVAGLHGGDALAYARERFSAVYGPDAAAMSVCLDAGLHGAPRIAAAVDTALIESLRTETAGKGLRLVSVRPSLVGELARCEAMIDAASGWFVQAGADRLCLLRFAGSVWCGVLNVRSDADATELPALIEQDAVSAGIEREASVIYLRGGRSAAQPLRDRGWTVRNLDLEGVAG